MSDDHHHKYWEREDGYVYTKDELDAYRVPMDKRNKCVNLYVPAQNCRNKKRQNSFLQSFRYHADTQLDNWGGECHKEIHAYKNCFKQNLREILAAPVREMYAKAPFYAKKEGVSTECGKQYYVTPMSY